jgi:methionyl-tRNA synthetase
MTDKPRFYITTAIAYPNGPPHIGHAYEAIATDAIARFMRLDGYDVFFLTGTDEHGLKMLQTATREGLSPRELADRNVLRFQAMVERLECSNDDYIRTTEERHHRSSQAIWDHMARAGDIYPSKYAGWYSVRDEAYYTEEETTLSADGERRGPTGTEVEWVEEESYFFRLSKYQQKLLGLYQSVPDFVLPRERLNEVVSFVSGGLQDLSISRTTFTWGIRVPHDPRHIMYVWVDALTNYITAVGFPDDPGKFWRWWPADLHVIGKDIVRFHAVYWPAFLMSAGLQVPRQIFSHGFLFNRGEKMSKSVGNVIDPFALIDQYGVDQLRYFFLREVPFGQDGNYSHEAIINRINADLANDLGNLAQRALTMIERNLNGIVPAPSELSPSDIAVLQSADAMISKAREAMEGWQLNNVLNIIWAVVADANRYFVGEAPWALAKTDPVRQGTVLYIIVEVLRQVAILCQPFMPKSAAKLLDFLGVAPEFRDFRALGGGIRTFAGRTLPAPKAVFPRYVEKSEGTTPTEMNRSILPPFNAFQPEAAIVGRLLAGYASLELGLLHCVQVVREDFDSVLKVMFRARGETQRIESADALGRQFYFDRQLGGDFEAAVGAVRHCLKVRNQYAHCQWYNDNSGKLAFVNLEELAQHNKRVHDLLSLKVFHVDVDLLATQEAYFVYADSLLAWINYEGRVRDKKIEVNPLTKPVPLKQPRLHAA